MSAEGLVFGKEYKVRDGVDRGGELLGTYMGMKKRMPIQDSL